MPAMSQTYGIEAQGRHPPAQHRKPVRYVVLIDAGGTTVAMLFLDSREQVAEIDAGAEEVHSMIAGIQPAIGALGAEWNLPLSGHSARDRRDARVYTLGL